MQVYIYIVFHDEDSFTTNMNNLSKNLYQFIATVYFLKK